MNRNKKSEWEAVGLTLFMIAGLMKGAARADEAKGAGSAVKVGSLPEVAPGSARATVRYLSHQQFRPEELPAELLHRDQVACSASIALLYDGA